MRRRQRITGICSAVLLAGLLLCLADGLVAGLRTGSDVLDLLPNGTVKISGPMPVKNPVNSDLTATFTPPDAPVRFVLDGFFSGYWFGSGMWRGSVEAESSLPQEQRRLRISFKGAAPQSAQNFVIRTWEDEASLRAGSASLLRRVLDVDPFAAAAVCGFAAALCGLLSYVLGRQYVRRSATFGYREVFRVQAEETGLRLWCASAEAGMAPGARRSVVDADGRPLGEAELARVHKGVVEFVLAAADTSGPPEAVRPGCFVLVRP